MLSKGFSRRTMNTDAERWLRQAERDLESAESNYRTQVWYVCAFLAQQAAEKALKALIVHQTGQEPPRLHSIQRLADIAGVRQEMSKEILALDDVYVASRYPVAAGTRLPYEVIDEPGAGAMLKLARGILTFVQERTA